MPPISQLLKWHVLLTHRLGKIELLFLIHIGSCYFPNNIEKPLVNNDGKFYYTNFILNNHMFEGERIHVYVWLSPFAVHLKLPQHC